MKKFLALVLAMLMLVSVFAGCAKTPATDNNDNNNPTDNNKPCLLYTSIHLFLYIGKVLHYVWYFEYTAFSPFFQGYPRNRDKKKTPSASF